MSHAIEAFKKGVLLWREPHKHINMALMLVSHRALYLLYFMCLTCGDPQRS